MPLAVKEEKGISIGYLGLLKQPLSTCMRSEIL